MAVKRVYLLTGRPGTGKTGLIRQIAAVLAHVDFGKGYRVGKYRVDIENSERV